jgi:hypothetical protein
MGSVLRGLMAAAIGVLLFCDSRVLADAGLSVQVQFAGGDTELSSLQNGVQFFGDQNIVLDKFPDELAGLDFTRRKYKDTSDVTISAPAQTTVYVFIGRGPSASAGRKALVAAGWKKLGGAHFSGDQSADLYVYKQSYTEPQQLTLPDGKGGLGVQVAAQHLVLAYPPPGDKTPAKPSDDTSGNGAGQDGMDQNSALSGPTTQLSKLQSSIKALYVIQQATGEKLGLAEDLILTATPGNANGKTIPVSFTVPVDREMRMVLADVCRAINVKYPHGEVSKYELSFGDKYTRHGGGSIGAACGTLLLSLIEGFDIDPKLSMTGDVTADGKIRVIGGLAAKMRGATDAGCDVMVVPADNYGQIVDAFIYEGPALLTNVQVIGVSNLDEATAVARVNREEKLQKAIDLFGDVQQILKNSPAQIHDKEIQDKLSEVLDLEPNDFSAKLLLLLSENKQPKKLSAAATFYYTNLAVDAMLPTLMDPLSQRTLAVNLATPAVVEAGLKKLQKVRWYADPQVLPLVNATQQLMEAINDVDNGQMSREALAAKAQAVMDEAAKLDTDRDLWQKMLHEGV